MHTHDVVPLPALVSSSWRIGIVHSLFHGEIVDRLAAAAERTLKEAGISASNIRRYPVAGSFEIPLIGSALLEAKEVDALIGLGVIVEGETHHAHLLAESVAHGIMDVQIKFGAPFAFEVLHVDALAQAEARAGATGNKGEEAARAVITSLAQLARFRS
ncbi:MAG: 6,7-dimethyl-8-ribityllumazine synthase [Candidatus Peribacteraceae bacterium]|nr:6,7-dimethyl-8-ribityllumazine synthase [Candidatus Peribacteraceae bacterium]MDD5075154.1 6,7-dimethyl-8-ribityllumazine synthase [Candidatus Peribacteraceae bacterium]